MCNSKNVNIEAKCIEICFEVLAETSYINTNLKLTLYNLTALSCIVYAKQGLELMDIKNLMWSRSVVYLYFHWKESHTFLQ